MGHAGWRRSVSRTRPCATYGPVQGRATSQRTGSTCGLEADVHVIGVVGLRERGPAEPEQGNDLGRLHVGGQEEQRSDGLVGHAARLLVARDRRPAERRHIDGQAEDVRRDDPRPCVEPMNRSRCTVAGTESLRG